MATTNYAKSKSGEFLFFDTVLPTVADATQWALWREPANGAGAFRIIGESGDVYLIRQSLLMRSARPSGIVAGG